MALVSNAALSLVILAVTVVLFIWNRLPVEVVALGCALTLLFTGLIDTNTVFSGFGDSVIVFIAALFVVSEGLEATGVTAWISTRLSRLSGTTYRRALPTVMALGAVVSAVITVNGAAAALLPVTIAVARRAGLAPSRVLIPLAFACSAGALLTLTGSPVNVIVNDASKTGGAGGFGFFEFALIGIPLTIATVGICALLGERLLPRRTPTDAPADLTDYRRTLAEHWTTDYLLWRVTVPDDSPSSGLPAGELVAEAGLILVAGQTDSGRVTSPAHALDPGDSLVVAFDPWSLVIAVIIYVILSMMACNEEEARLALKEGASLCHSVGTYCSSSFLGICVTKKDVYCCFQSKISRILQEQGRPQIGKPWGKPKTETCEGFSIFEFQQLDLAAMDFSEVYADFMEAAKLPDEAAALVQIQQKIADYYAAHKP